MEGSELWLEVYNEVVRRPDGMKIRRIRWQGTEVEEELELDRSTRIGMGHALRIGKGGSSSAVRVRKRWEPIGDRELLVESVEYGVVEQWGSSVGGGLIKVGRAESRDRLAELLPWLEREGGWAQVDFEERKRGLEWERAAWVLDGVEAYWAKVGPAVAVDYEIESGLTDFTFQSDTTYYVTGTVYLYGTTRWEGGAVVKFAPDPSQLCLCAKGPQQWQTDPYRPVIFTARDDDTVGERIAESTGNPSGYYAKVAYYIVMPG
ncbi:MAG: hypothetical protein H5T92_08125 [Synergistales bacterium]|nr:hypothetical protein [Synergistales bacterium]